MTYYDTDALLELADQAENQEDVVLVWDAEIDTVLDYVEIDGVIYENDAWADELLQERETAQAYTEADDFRRAQ